MVASGIQDTVVVSEGAFGATLHLLGARSRRRQSAAIPAVAVSCSAAVVRAADRDRTTRLPEPRIACADDLIAYSDVEGRLNESPELAC